MIRAALVLLALVPTHAWASEPEPRRPEARALFEPRSVAAARATGPITLDGALDEPAWATAQPGDRFIQEGPHPGEPATLATSFRVLFDADALYIGVRLDDPAAHAIQAPLGRRDDENNADWCFVEIDSRRDRRTAFSFGINPAGLQVDGVFVNDSEYDASWNAVWQAVTRVDASGWTAEYRIPFAALAFAAPDGDAMRWGINVYRSNPHTGEVSNWSPRVPQLAGVVSQFNELVVAAAPHVRRVDVTPYVLAQAGRGASGNAIRAGADANLGITPGVGLAATVLPDFGQVEADPTQLNLTTFELFQTERRPFFTEGIDAFRFNTALPLVSRDDSFADEAAFYSRRIGRGPELAVPEGATAALASDILGAAKLFGRSASGWRAGVLAAASDGVDARSPAGATTAVTAPAASVVARVVKESSDGNAALGVFASELHRFVGDDLAAELPRDARALGADARIRWADQTYEARTWALATDQAGTAAAIARLAAEPWHDLARVDAPRLALDPGATQLTGISAETRLAKVGGDLLWSVSARAISPGFDVNGLGFQRNTDWALAAGQWSYTMYPHASAVRHWQVGSDNAGVGWSWGGERRAAVIDGYVRLDFANYWDATVTAQHEASVRSTEWLRGGPALALPPRDTFKLDVHTDTRRPSYAGLDAIAVTEPGSGSFELGVTPSVTVRASDHVAGTVGASYSDQVIGWQPVAGAGTLTDTDLAPAPADTYLVGRLHQRTLSLSLEADVAISPRLIVQLYAQPFITDGRYGRYALLADPTADAASARFSRLSASEVAGDADTITIKRGTAFALARPDATTRSVIASAVARWELAPGSFVTAVWSHRGGTAEPDTDVVLVKLGWRFAP